MALVLSGRVGDDQALEIANDLWRDTDPVLNNSTGPGSPFDWVFMVLPEISLGQAERSFRRKWLTARSISEGELSGHAQRMLSQLGPAIASLESRERLLPLTEDEAEHVSGQLLRFVKSFLGNSVTLGSGTNIMYMTTVIGAITVPGRIAEELFKIAEAVLGTESTQRRNPMQPLGDLIYDVRRAISFSLIPGLVRALPDRSGTMAMWLSSGLGSGEEIRVNNAMVATGTWALTPEELALQAAPDSLIREVGAIVASRRKDALVGALLCATSIFDRGIQSHREAIATFALHGLSYLAEEVQYERYQEDEDVPTVRLLCVQLASYMARSGFADNATVVKWMDIGKNDPFPEVRKVVVPAEEGQLNDAR